MVERLRRFLADPESDSFAELARAAFAFQYERVSAYRALCDRRGIGPGEIADWREVPLVPTAAYRTLELAAAPALEVFRSSGTGGQRSVHHHGFPDLYRAAIDASFPRACWPFPERAPILSLVPPRDVLPDSSLSFMVAHVLAHWGSPESTGAAGRAGVETAKARSWLGARQRAGRPVLVVATAFALLDLLDFLARQELRFRLPAGSVVFETGGFKGRTREVTRADLVRLTSERLGIPQRQVVREYGMSELTSQCYTGALAGGDPDVFVAPHWMRVRVLDPLSLTEAAPGATGVLAIFDLANLSSAIHLLTEDVGRSVGDGFELLGRAAGAELRGCSLAMEELGHAAP